MKKNCLYSLPLLLVLLLFPDKKKYNLLYKEYCKHYRADIPVN